MCVKKIIVVLVYVTTVSKKTRHLKVIHVQKKDDVGRRNQLIGVTKNIIICILLIFNNCMYTILIQIDNY